MPRRALTGLAGALVAGLALTSSAAAGAATYCVHHSGCSGSANVASIQAAITKASADGALDTILVGPGSYHGPFSAAYGNPVALVGAGDATVLDAPGTGVPTNDDNRTTLALGDPGSSASSLAVVAPVGNGGAGVAVPNSDRLKVTDTGSSTGATGLAAIGTSDHARVTMTGAGSHGVLLAGRLRHARVSATANAVSGNGVVENSLLRLTQAGGQGIAVGLGGSGSVDAHQVTLIGPNDSDSRGVEATASSTFGGASADARLDGVVIIGFGHALEALSGSYTCGMFMTCTNPASITVSYSDFDPSHDVDPFGDITIGAGNLNASPGFRNTAAGDFRLRHNSPLVDAGDPATPLTGDSNLDLNNAPRVVDGNRNGSAVVDMGAFEVQPFFGLKTLVTLKLGATKIPAAGPMPIVVSNLNGFPVNGSVSGQTAGKIPVGKHKKRHVSLTPKRFALGAHQSSNLLFGLPKPAAARLEKKGRLTFALLATVHDPDGDTRTLRATVTVKLKGKKKKH